MGPETGQRSLGARALERFFGEQPMQAMVIARIGLGLLLFFAWALKFRYIQTLYGPDGIGGHAFQERIPGAFLARPLEASLQLLVQVSSPELIWLLYILLLAASLCFAAGAFTRSAGLIALVLHALFHARNHYATQGWAVLLKPFLFFVLMAPVGRFGSLDAWWRRKRRPLVPVQNWSGPGWTVRLLQMQICMMYAAASWSRFDNPGWLNGDILFMALDGRRYGRFDIDWFPVIAVLSWLSYGALVLEPLAPFLLWLKGIGKWWALALIGMHLALEIGTNISWWQFLMISLLPVFLPASWLTALIRAPARFISGHARGGA